MYNSTIKTNHVPIIISLQTSIDKDAITTTNGVNPQTKNPKIGRIGDKR